MGTIIAALLMSAEVDEGEAVWVQIPYGLGPGWE